MNPSRFGLARVSDGDKLAATQRRNTNTNLSRRILQLNSVVINSIAILSVIQPSIAFVCSAIMPTGRQSKRVWTVHRGLETTEKTGLCTAMSGCRSETEE